jgi:hypothetical protein
MEREREREREREKESPDNTESSNHYFQEVGFDRGSSQS